MKHEQGVNQWKKGLKSVYEPPVPERKEAFLTEISPEGALDFGAMLFRQIAYIHKMVWLSAVAFLGLAVWVFPRLQGDTVWVMAECAPLLALLMILETMRSKRFQMWELEAAARFSLRSILLARVLLIGMFDSVILLLTACFLAERTPYGFWLVSAYLLLPSLITVFGGMVIELTPYGRGKEYAAPGFAVLVSGTFWIAQESGIPAFRQENGCWWELFTVVFFCFLVMFFRKIMREEFTWNW